jgi:hypothetical protein
MTSILQDAAAAAAAAAAVAETSQQLQLLQGQLADALGSVASKDAELLQLQVGLGGRLVFIMIRIDSEKCSP